MNTFTVIVNAINDAPVLSQIGSGNFDEDESLIILLSAFDVEGDILTYFVSGGINISWSLSGSELTFTANQDFNGSEEFIVTVSDGVDEDSETFEKFRKLK